MCSGSGRRRDFRLILAAPQLSPDIPAETSEDDGENEQSERQMTLREIAHHVDNLRPVFHDQRHFHAEADGPAEEDREHEGDRPHLEDAGSEDEKLPRGRGWKHRWNQDGKEFLLLKARAQRLKMDTVDAAEEKQLAARPAQEEGNQAADRGARCGQQSVKVEVALVLPGPHGHKKVDGDGDGGRIDEGPQQHSPGPEGEQRVLDEVVELEKQAFQERGTFPSVGWVATV